MGRQTIYRPPRSRRRRTRRTVSPFALLFASALLVVSVWTGYRWLTAPRDDASATTPAATPVERFSASVVPLLESRGDVRIRSSEPTRIEIETPVSSDDLASFLRPKLAAYEVGATGSTVRIRKGESIYEISMTPLRTADSGAGLEEAADAAAPTESASERRRDAAPPSPSRSDSPAERTAASGERTIVLIIDDVGYERDAELLEQATAIDPAINFAVIPWTPRASESAQYLAARGFEILCHLPMEPINYPRQRPGEGAILTSMKDDEIVELTLRDIRSIPSIRGVNNHMGSRATMDRRVMRSVLTAVRSEGLYFVDSRTTPRSIAEETARQLDVRTLGRDVFLDDDESDAAIRRQIRQLARLADRRSPAVGIGHVYPSTIRVLREEVPRLRAEGYVFIRASEAVR